MIGDDIDWSQCAFEVMMPYTESFENGQEFFIMSVVVQLGGAKGVGMKSHRMNFTIISNNRENCHQGIVRSIGFNDDLLVRNPMGEDGSSGEGNLKFIKGRLTPVGPLPGHIFAGKVG